MKRGLDASEMVLNRKFLRIPCEDNASKKEVLKEIEITRISNFTSQTNEVYTRGKGAKKI